MRRIWSIEYVRHGRIELSKMFFFLFSKDPIHVKLNRIPIIHIRVKIYRMVDDMQCIPLLLRILECSNHKSGKRNVKPNIFCIVTKFLCALSPSTSAELPIERRRRFLCACACVCVRRAHQKPKKSHRLRRTSDRNTDDSYGDLFKIILIHKIARVHSKM